MAELDSDDIILILGGHDYRVAAEDFALIAPEFLESFRRAKHASRLDAFGYSSQRLAALMWTHHGISDLMRRRNPDAPGRSSRKLRWRLSVISSTQRRSNVGCSVRGRFSKRRLYPVSGDGSRRNLAAPLLFVRPPGLVGRDSALDSPSDSGS